MVSDGSAGRRHQLLRYYVDTRNPVYLRNNKYRISSRNKQNFSHQNHAEQRDQLIQNHVAQVGVGIGSCCGDGCGWCSNAPGLLNDRLSLVLVNKACKQCFNTDGALLNHRFSETLDPHWNIHQLDSALVNLLEGTAVDENFEIDGKNCVILFHARGLTWRHLR